MSAQAHAPYRPYHPRWYRRRVSVWWWLKKPSYALFVFRELTSLAVAYVAFLLLFEVRALAAGPEAHARFLGLMGRPAFLVANAVAAVLLVYHSVTWFNLAPKAMVVRLGGRRVPDVVIAGSNYVAWLVLSLALALLVLR